jgi:hypothetical protein
LSRGRTWAIAELLATGRPGDDVQADAHAADRFGEVGRPDTIGARALAQLGAVDSCRRCVVHHRSRRNRSGHRARHGAGKPVVLSDVSKDAPRDFGE